ncbi:MAG: hypothetical protein K2P81_01045 [Bacteriovoracaceae bacterium]|nr:hypothetical protein [Bacteriovoracaceae bacterium]
MSDEKKDLTRIEDLGEFLHELDDTENFLELPAIPEDATTSDDLPEIPADEDVSFGEALPEIPTEEEASPAFGEETSDFGNDETAAFGEESPVFGEEAPAFESDSSSFEVEQSQDDPFSETTEEVATFETPEEDNPSFETENSDTENNDTTDPFTSINESISEAAEFATSSEAEVENEPAAEVTQSNYQDAKPLDDSFDPEVYEEEPQSLKAEPEAPLESQYTPKEDFKETRDFAQNAVLDDSPTECNPSYSVIARNIRYLEDSEEILTLLKEVGFPQDMMDQFKRQIERGTLLIPRISEFSAIYISHKLRRFRLELQMGLSDLLHPPKHSKDNEKGLVSKRTLGQNQQHNFQFKGDTDSARSIILSTLPQLDGHAVDRYLGVASEHSFLDSQQVENETADAIHKSYDELAQKLKGHALHSKANAVLGINYQLTPMPLENTMGSYRYKLTCTGNLVWVHKLSV